MTAKTKALGVFLSVLMVMSVVAVPAAAAVNLSLSGSAGSTPQPGDTVTVSFTLENTGDTSANGPAINVTGIPSGWTVASHSDDGGTFKSSTTTWVWLSLGAGSSKNPSITFNVPSDASTGDYTISAKATTSGTATASTDVTVTVSDQPAEPSATPFTITQGPIEYERNGNNLQVAFNRSVSAPSGFNYYIVEDRTGNVVQSGNLGSASTVGSTGFEISLNSDLEGDHTLKVDNTGNAHGNRTAAITVTSATADIENGQAIPDDAIFQGEMVAVYTGDTSEQYEILQGGSVQFGGSSDSSMTVAAESSDSWDTDSAWSVRDADSATNVTFDVRDLGLSVSVEQTSYQTTGTSTTVSGTVSADFTNRNVLVELTADNGTVVDSKVVNTGASREVDFSFTGVGTDSYTFNVTDISSGVEAGSAEFTVSTVTGSAGFAQTVFTEERGDVAEFTVNLNNVDSATVFVGSDDINYLVELTVTDGSDGDTNVVVQLDTYKAAMGAGAYSVETESNVDTPDSVSVTAIHESVAAPLGTGSYSLNASVAGDETGVATVEITSRSTDSMSTWVAPKGAKTSTVSEITSNAVQQSQTAIDDKVILQITASGIYSLVDSKADLSASALGASEGIYLSIVQTNEGANQAPNVLDASDVSVVADPAANTFYAVIDTSSSDFPDLAAGQQYKATFVINETNALIADTDSQTVEKETVSTTFTVQSRTVTVDNLNATSKLNVNPQNATVSGTTTLAPGSTLSVRVKSTTEGRPYLLTAPEVTVSEDGTWSTSFDFSGRQGTSFDLSVRVGGTTLTTVSGAVLPPPTASVTFNDQTSSGESVVVASATLSRGGFVAIHEGSASGPIIGTSKFLTSGSHSNVRIALDEPISEDTTLVAMPHIDEDSNNLFNAAKDGAYTAQGAPVTDDAAITVSAGTPTTKTVVKTRTVVKESPTPVVQTRTVQKTVVKTQVKTQVKTVVKTATPGQPGFGIAIAVVALLAAALLAIRRRD